MKIHDVMANEVKLIGAAETVHSAARMMIDQNIGFLPVAEDDHLVGVITDRDIVKRVVAEGRMPTQTPITDAMTRGIKYCYEDENILDTAHSMKTEAVCRMPVINRDKRLVGVVSIEDLRQSYAKAA